MYKIIGADGKAYGPVSEEQIRHWIAESRIHAGTQVQAEGTDEWKPLGGFPEFAETFAGPDAPIPPSVPPFQSSTNLREAALHAVKGPALALKITAIVTLVFLALSFLTHVLIIAGVHLRVPGTGWMQIRGWLQLPWDVIGMALAGVVFVGSEKMGRLKDYPFAFAVSILAMLPCSLCCLVSLPFGIWALVTLNRPEVKSQFTK